MNHGIIPYIGGKHRLAHRLVEYCAGTAADTFVDVFGGSAAVTLAATDHFTKLIYNDVDGDLVNLFRVISTPPTRVALFKLLRWLPPSRKIFEDDHLQYLAGGLSFCRIADPVERARRTFYRHMFAFGGKVRNGGFALSTGDSERFGIKEVRKYRNALQKLVRIGSLFRQVAIENQHYSETLTRYGRSSSTILFVDPPYLGTEGCYSRSFGAGDHAFLAEQLTSCQAKAVCTYYDHPTIRGLYPPDRWDWHCIIATKNSPLGFGNKPVTSEMVIVKK